MAECEAATRLTQGALRSWSLTHYPQLISRKIIFKWILNHKPVDQQATVHVFRPEYLCPGNKRGGNNIRVIKRQLEAHGYLDRLFM